MNRDTALCVAQVAEETPSVESFLFLSAKASPPFVGPGYLESKIEVERALRASPLRHIIFRPGLIYSDDNPITLGAAFGITAFDHVMKKLDPLLPSTAQTTIHTLRDAYHAEPLNADIIGQAVVQATFKSAKGTYDPQAILELSQEANPLAPGE